MTVAVKRVNARLEMQAIRYVYEVRALTRLLVELQHFDERHDKRERGMEGVFLSFIHSY